MLNCLFFANSLPEQHCRSGPSCGSSTVLSPFLSVSPLFSIPPTFLLSLPASSQLSERGPSAGTGSAGSTQLAPHTGCCQPAHLTHSMHQPGLLIPHSVPAQLPRHHQPTGGFEDEHSLVRLPAPTLLLWHNFSVASIPGVLDASAAGNSNFISPDLLDCKGPSSLSVKGRIPESEPRRREAHLRTVLSLQSLFHESWWHWSSHTLQVPICYMQLFHLLVVRWTAK